MVKNDKNKKEELKKSDLNKVQGGAEKFFDVKVPDNPDPTIDPVIDPVKDTSGETKKTRPISESLYR